MPVISVAEDQAEDAAGTLTDVYTITFSIPPHPGNFVVQVPQSGDPVAAANTAIRAKEGEVGGIYGL